MSYTERTYGRRFLRDPANGYLGGICAGIARGLSIPAAAPRIAAVIALLLWPTLVVILYVLAWLFIDSRDEPPRCRGRASLLP